MPREAHIGPAGQASRDKSLGILRGPSPSAADHSRIVVSFLGEEDLHPQRLGEGEAKKIWDKAGTPTLGDG